MANPRIKKLIESHGILLFINSHGKLTLQEKKSHASLHNPHIEMPDI